MATRPPEGDGGDRPALADDPPRSGVMWLESCVTVGLVIACVVFTAAQLHPELILRDTTPNGGDMGAHVWAPAYLRDHLLPNWQLTGWAPDWYAGFPALRFYMVPPMLAIVALDVALPYGVAFKIVTVSGVLSLPVAAWAFGRLAGLRFPSPALLAVAAVLFLFERDFSIYGGNIASTLAGEFAFSISLSLAVVYLGLVANGLRTGRYRAWAAVVVALCGLTHVIPLVFAIVGTFVLFAVFPSRRGAVWLLTAAPVGALLAAWWLLPFWGQRAFLNDMGWVKLVPPADAGFGEQLGWWLTELFPRETRWSAVLAVGGLLVSGLRRVRVGAFLAVMILVGALAFWQLPQGRLWNARLLPFVHLCTYMLAAVGIAETLRATAEMAAGWGRAAIRVAGAVVVLAAALFVLALPLRSLPFFGEVDEDGTYSWLFVETGDHSFIPGWARWNYRGYEGKGADWHEYEDVVLTMAGVGERQGCGRAMWEYSPELDRYGTPMALMLLPYWTDGCIGSMEGLYFESSTTTPFHFLNQSALSAEPSRAQRGLPYGSYDIDLGVGQLQMLGVRYYMAQSEEAIEAASAEPALTEVGRSGPSLWVITLSEARKRSWVVYEVAGAPLVEGLDRPPAVLDDPPANNEGWIEATADWFQTPARWGTHIAAGGPDSWRRVDADAAVPEQGATRVLEPVAVSDVRRGNDWISFDVSTVGVPVVVKESYFPNWDVTGADGPWRISPNFMVVVPTESRVELTYGTEPVEVAGWGLTALGCVGLALLVLAGPLRERSGRRADSASVVTPGIVDHPSYRAPPPGARRLSVVVPAFRESSVIGEAVTRLRRELETFAPDLEIVVVDDGSDDDTAERARVAGADRVVELGRNRGKGAAVRAGVAVATGRIVAFTDADLAYSPDQVVDVAEAVEEGWDLAVGNRHAHGAVAETEASLLRRAGGWFVNRLARLVVGDQTDTQCGLKAFRSDVARLVFADSRIDGFGFDVEVFALARWHGLSLRSVPVRVVNSSRSTVRVVRDGVAVAADLVRIEWWLRHDAYTPPADADLPPAGSLHAEH